MFTVPVRFAMSAALVAMIVTAVAQPLHAAPLPQTEARVLCVDLAGGATGAPCANADAYPTIQAAVEAAQSGDEIRIAKGVYTGTYTGMDDPKQYSVVVIPGKSLKLVGGFAPDNWTTPDEANKTVIDGQDQVRGITAWNGKIALEHLTMTRGVTRNSSSYTGYSCSTNSGCGGAIYSYNGDVSLENVVINGNHATRDGGGIYGGKVTLVDSLIINNRADGGGGGIMADEVDMVRSTVEGNRALGVGNLYALGGGISAWKFSAVDSMITQNTAMHAGGVNAGNAVIERTRIEHNTAVLGGGLFLDTRSTIVNSIINNNTASEQGGGLYINNGGIEVTSTMLSNNIAGSAGDAVYASDRSGNFSVGLYLRNTTIVSAERAPHEAIRVEGARAYVIMFDTAITNYAIGMARINTSSVYGDYNAFFNNGADYTVDGAVQPLPFANLITADPQFVDPAAGNFHLQPNSPLIDRGDLNRAYLQDQRDIDGDAVPYGGRADIGADEWVGTYRMWTPVIAK